MAGELITGDGQVQFKDYLLGDEEVTFMDAINGWEDLPTVDSGNASRPASHGSWVGHKLAQERIVTWEGRFVAEPNEWAQKLKELRSTFTLPVGTEEDAIIVQLHDEKLLAFGSVSNRSLPGDRSYGYYGAKLVLQFICSDPRRYSILENAWTLELPPVSDNGLIYPLTYPLDYGVEVNSSSGTLVNAGDILTPVILEFNGPVENPGITNASLGARLQFNITLATGETLSVDTRTGAVLLNGTADRLYTRTVDSAPIFSFGLQPGDNDIQLTATSWSLPAAVTIRWRDATL